jgi:hypothetical protein
MGIIKKLKILLWSLKSSVFCPLCKTRLEVYGWVKSDDRWWTTSKRDKYEVYCSNPDCDFGKGPEENK